MAVVAISDSILTDIADAIRSKNGTENTYKPAQMPDAIEAINGGGITPTGTKQISITQNGTTTEDVTNYASAEITVNVSGGSFNPLPSGFSLLDYIESSGTQYIDLGLYTTATQQYYLKYKPSSPSSTTNVMGNNLSTGCGMFVQNTDSVLYYRFGSTNYASTTKLLTGIDISYSIMMAVDGLYVEDPITGEYVILASISSSVTEDSSIHNILFGRTTSSSARQLSSLKIYYCKVVDDGTTIREMYPCTRDSDSVIGMYDITNDVFYTNAGSGTFTGGTL